MVKRTKTKVFNICLQCIEIKIMEIFDVCIIGSGPADAVKSQ